MLILVLGNYLFICDGTAAWIIKTDGTVTQVVADSVKSLTLTAAGSGFTDGTYSLGFSGGGGTGAAGTYTVVGGVVTSLSLTTGGSGYTTPPIISFPSGGGTGATATAAINSFPTPHIPTPTFIDGYVILAKSNSVDVYT